jgi:mannose-1-phosphate guanylyltransferase
MGLEFTDVIKFIERALIKFENGCRSKDLREGFAFAFVVAAEESEAIKHIFSECRPISIDYGVMEMADNVYVISGDFGWSDVGTWGSVYQNLRKDRYANAYNQQQVYVYNTRNTLISLPKEKVAVVNGLKDYIVVDTEDALLICPMSDEQNIKSYIEEVRFATGDKHI